MSLVIFARTQAEAEANIEKYTTLYQCGVITLQEATELIIKSNKDIN